MKYFLSFLIFLFFGLLESTILPFNFLLILTILFAVNLQAKEAFFWAFTAGVLADLFMMQRLGITSAFFLALVFVLFIYKRKFKLLHITYLLPFTIIAVFFSQVLFGKQVNLINIAVTLVLMTVFLPLSRVFFARFEGEENELRLME